MQKSDFYYELPDALIAQAPLAERSAARMLIVDGRQGTWEDARICDLPDLLQPGDLLVLNDTRVLPARLQARKATGGAVELLLDRLVDAREGWFLAKSSKALRPGMRVHLPGGAVATVEEKDGMDVRLILSADAQWLPILEAEGSMPLPPYIRRVPEASDRERYQTIYAAHPGAVAAPTAGLHFDANLLAALAARGVERTFVTLHVGAGTFLPVRSDDITEHPMHAETMEVSATTVAAGMRRSSRTAREPGPLPTSSTSGSGRPAAASTASMSAVKRSSRSGRYISCCASQRSIQVLASS